MHIVKKNLYLPAVHLPFLAQAVFLGRFLPPFSRLRQKVFWQKGHASYLCRHKKTRVTAGS